MRLASERCCGLGVVDYSHQPSSRKVGAWETTLWAGDGGRRYPTWLVRGLVLCEVREAEEGAGRPTFGACMESQTPPWLGVLARDGSSEASCLPLVRDVRGIRGVAWV